MMNFLKIPIETKSDRWIFNTATVSGFLWLFIVFMLRRIFKYYSLDAVVLGTLPNFFAAVFVYLLLYLKYKSKIKAALLTFGMLALGEVIQFFTPRTYDNLDLIASIIGIGCAEAIRLVIERNFSKERL